MDAIGSKSFADREREDTLQTDSMYSTQHLLKNPFMNRTYEIGTDIAGPQVKICN